MNRKKCKIDDIINNKDSYIQVIPNDYLKLGKDKKYEEAINAIWKHVGKAKQYY